ncbi:hypothetical protein E2C01_010204 [Portunus trituberculatus]|uniref:Uncharacterized protein n=1 Tax=Portunus trituberculatus TaxID=210409 RepID=A0A5B7D800_PORTR|nr:hypothetical protein [Portunus trituberculatus]
MASFACWSSGLRLRGTPDAATIGVERGDRRGNGMVSCCGRSKDHCAILCSPNISAGPTTPVKDTKFMAYAIL